MSTGDARVVLLQGTLDLLILQTLLPGPAHGHDIMKAIGQSSDQVLQVEQGSLYPALHRLEGRGLLQAEWRPSEDNRNAKYYRLTAAGRKLLAAEHAEWQRFMTAVQRVMEAM
jgi:PadR family transcriptional regulator PadR